MAINSGKSSEKIFEAFLDRLGKRAYYCRLVDAAEIYGRVGRMGHVRPQPSDYIVTIDGHTSYSEVKSTKDPKGFRLSLIRKGQSAAARQVLGAGGSYLIYVHSLHQNRWYRIPYSFVQETGGKGSIPWAALQEFEWNPNTLM